MADDDLVPVKGRLSAATILLVDDTPYFRTLLCNFLDPLGLGKLLEARNGKEALGHIARERVDLIVCDWKMPEMDGLELLRHVRCHPDWNSIPFIMITGQADKHVVVESVRLKVTDFLVKPVDAKTLARKVAKALAAPPPPADEVARACATSPAAEDTAGEDLPPDLTPDSGAER
jgi:two-component system chemotaxis response regulator CheY